MSEFFLQAGSKQNWTDSVRRTLTAYRDIADHLQHATADRGTKEPKFKWQILEPAAGNSSRPNGLGIIFETDEDAFLERILMIEPAPEEDDVFYMWLGSEACKVAHPVTPTDDMLETDLFRTELMKMVKGDPFATEHIQDALYHAVIAYDFETPDMPIPEQ